MAVTALKSALSLALVAITEAHGGLTFPVPRNNYDAISPTNYTARKNCTQCDYSGGSCAGDMCLWFNEGCFIGCPTCSSATPVVNGTSGEVPDRYIKPNCAKPMEPTLPEAARSWNRGNRSVYGDWTRYHPWRAPGHAPVADPCGMAGAYKTFNPVGGETPIGAKQFDKGSLLPKSQRPAKWLSGGVMEVGWMPASNHGGGYVYSLCPANESLTEACFRRTTLPFVGNHHTIRHLDNDTELQIPAMQVSVGTSPPGSVWRRNPIPACNCDAGKGCTTNAHDPSQPSYPKYYQSYWNGTQPLPKGPESCATGTQFPVAFNAVGSHGYGQDMFGRTKEYMWAIVDKVQLPKVTGDYVLRWRWDQEQTPQIWSHCADVTIVAGETAAPAAPAVQLQNAATKGSLPMPVTGLGTGCAIGGCKIGPGSDMVAYNMSLQWLKIGGRRFDAADSYGCEPGIGLAIKHSGVARSEVFIESKTGPGGLAWPLGYNETIRQGRAIAKNYSSSYVDLLLVHWPVNYGPCKYHGPPKGQSIPTTDPLCDTALPSYDEKGCRLSTWRGLVYLWKTGAAKAVGVSNWNSTHFQEIADAGLPMPSVNQFPFSPFNGPTAMPCNHATPGTETCAQLLVTMKKYKVVANGYSPFGGAGKASKLLSDPRLLKIAKAHNTGTAQVVLAWQWFAHGVVVNPEAQKLAYQQENLQFFDVKLSAAEIAVLDNWK